MKKFFTLCLLLVNIGLCSAQYHKMSPLVRQAAREGKALPALANGTRAADAPRLIAFVRTTDSSVLASEGCDVLLDLGDIVIASIPLHNIEQVAALPQVKQIAASQSSTLLNDQSASRVFADKLWSTPTPTLPGLTGKDVVVGVVDAGIDFSHPTFRTADGSQLRIKAVWDWLDFTDGGSSVVVDNLMIGRQYIGEEEILAKMYSADSYIRDLSGHGTHTAATAAGSGFNGTEVSPYSGMAPEADLCMVSVTEGSNTHLIPENKKYLYTDATNDLAFKYIFDYAESQGKPCVINISMGSPEDLYQSKIANDAISRLVGPGKIICSTAGNEAKKGNYIFKGLGEEKKGAFLLGSSTNNAWLLSSTEYPVVNLTFYPKNEEKIEWTYDTERLREYPGSPYNDTLQIDGRKVYLEIYAYPSWVDEKRIATDIVISTVDENVIGTALPVALTLTGASMEIEAFAQFGSFKKDERDTSLGDFDNTHSIFSPGSCDDVICVGAVSYRDKFLNYKGETVDWSYHQTDGVRTDFSSIGPNKRGAIKPEVMAPGQNVISAMNSSFYENLSEEDYLQDYVAEKFESNGRTYGWYVNSGTSQAAPVVTGVIALWLQENPTLTPDQVREVIMNTSTHTVSGIAYPNNEYGYGLIDAEAGVEYIRTHFGNPTHLHGVETLDANNANTIYSISGQRITDITDRHGIFVVTKDGKARKVIK